MSKLKWAWKIPDTALFNKKKYNKLMDTEIKSTLLEMTSIAQKNIMDEAPTGYTGILKDSIQATVAKNVGRVFPGVKYAYFVENGRNPGRMPPLRPIMGWLAKAPKGMERFANMNAAGILTGSSTESRLKQAAFMVSRAIGLRGTRANPFFDRGTRKSRNALRVENNKLLTKLS
jgi:hypothetical protein